MGWQRVGSCPPEQCQGRCCQHIGTWYADTADTRDFVRTLEVRGVSVKLLGGQFLVSIPQRCQWLREDNLCALHPSIAEDGMPPRPEFCARWPEEPSQLVNDPYCGFRFIKDDEELENP